MQRSGHVIVIIMVVLILVLALAMVWTRPAAGLDAEAGRRLAERWCSACHSVEQRTGVDQAPTFEAIAEGSYPVSRPLFIYVKKAHIGVIPGIEEFVAEFTSEKAWGDEGYLTEKGMIPMPMEERTKFADDAKMKNTLARL